MSWQTFNKRNLTIIYDKDKSKGCIFQARSQYLPKAMQQILFYPIDRSMAIVLKIRRRVTQYAMTRKLNIFLVEFSPSADGKEREGELYG